MTFLNICLTLTRRSILKKCSLQLVQCCVRSRLAFLNKTSYSGELFFFFFPVCSFWKTSNMSDSSTGIQALRIFSELPSMAYCPALVFQYLVAGRKEGLAYLRLREGITRQDIGKKRIKLFRKISTILDFSFSSTVSAFKYLQHLIVGNNFLTCSAEVRKKHFPRALLLNWYRQLSEYKYMCSLTKQWKKYHESLKSRIVNESLSAI